jgi:hypothetical protein
MDVVTKYILYLSSNGMTDPLGQLQILPYLNGLSIIELYGLRQNNGIVDLPVKNEGYYKVCSS